MLSYYGPEKLENLLDSLFADDDESTSEDVMILWGPVPLELLGQCCTYSYLSYG